MIAVTIYTNVNGDISGFDIEGHAGYAEAGRDVVCSAVSVLCINTINAIESFTEDDMTYDVDEHNAAIYFRLQKKHSPDTQLLLKTMVLGLQSLEDNSEYEPYMDIIFKEV